MESGTLTIADPSTRSFVRVLEILVSILKSLGNSYCDT